MFFVFIRKKSFHSIIFRRGYFQSQWNLVRSSRRIQKILSIQNEIFDEKSEWMNLFFDDLNQLHHQYQLKSIAQSTKNLYEINSSKFNEKYLCIEKQRKNHQNDFSSLNSKENHLLLHLRYYRYLKITSIYRFITFNLDRTIDDLNQFLCQSIQNQIPLSTTNSETFRYELTFFILALSSDKTSKQFEKIFSLNSIEEYFLRSFEVILNEKRSADEIDHLSSTFISIQFHSSSNSNSNSEKRMKIFSHLFKDLFEHRQRYLSEENLQFLSTIVKTSNQSNWSDFLPHFHRFFLDFQFEKANLTKLYYLFDLISSMKYSHENFHRKFLQRIEQILQQSKTKEIQKDLKLFCHLICLFCSSDPQNRFSTRPTILHLTNHIGQLFQLNKGFQLIHWIVQCQHSMMLCHIYDYSLISKTIQQKSLPLLFRQLGRYSLRIRRQIFEIEQILQIDRPDFHSSLFNEPTNHFLQQIHRDYREEIRPKNETKLEMFLQQLKTSFDLIYGDDQANIIRTEQIYPFLLFDFLEVKYPDKHFLRSIQIDEKQRIAFFPVLNSMLIHQQRSDGNIYRIFNPQTTMRFRMISKQNFLLLPIFFGQFHRAQQDRQLKEFFDKTLINKTNRRFEHL